MGAKYVAEMVGIETDQAEVSLLPMNPPNSLRLEVENISSISTVAEV